MNEFLKNHKRLEDVYIGMIAKRLNTPIRNYAPHYILDRDASVKDKTNLLARIKITDIYFLYEPEHFSYYWEIFVKNGSNIRSTPMSTLAKTSITSITTTIS